MRIHSIEPDSQWKITSGSFIYGPTTAVKELIDNSIDSNAKNIFIDIDSKTGGCDYISVRDDGMGVDGNDRPSMCLNHTTSKITSLEDLSNLTALGFRGEALFMLANLSTAKGSMQIISKTQDESIGTKWFVDKQGMMKQKSICRVSCPKGTTVIIRELLGSLRARNIEMRSNVRRTLEEIKYLINHYSIDYRKIRFNLSFVSLKKNGVVSLKQLQQSINTKISKARVISSILHLKKMVDVNFILIDDLVVNNNIKLELILPRMLPDSDVINVKKSMKFISVNNRPLHLQLCFGKSINKMINSIYRDFKLLEPQVWYINVKIVPKIIDINIEPEKNDILLKDQDRLLVEFRDRLHDTLDKELNVRHGNELGETTQAVINSSQGIVIENNIPTSIDKSKKIETGYVDDNDNTTLMNEYSPSNLFAEDGKEDDNDGLDDETIKRVFVDESDNSDEIIVNDHQIQDKTDVTIDTMESHDGEWTHSLLEKSPSNEIEVIGLTGEISSPLEYDNGNIHRMNDDLELSKDASLSNPFMITKINNLHRTKKQETIRQNDNNIPLEQLINKKRRVSVHTEEKLLELQNKNNLKIVKPKKVLYGKDRKLPMFSEYTNSYLLTMNYSEKKFPPLTEPQADNDIRTTSIDVPDSIKGGLKELFPDYNNTNEQSNLSKTGDGWYMFKPSKSD